MNALTAYESPRRTVLQSLAAMLVVEYLGEKAPRALLVKAGAVLQRPADFDDTALETLLHEAMSNIDRAAT